MPDVALLGPGAPFLHALVVAFLFLVRMWGTRFGKREYLVRGQLPEDVASARPFQLSIKSVAFLHGPVCEARPLVLRLLAFGLDHEYVLDGICTRFRMLAQVAAADPLLVFFLEFCRLSK